MSNPHARLTKAQLLAKIDELEAEVLGYARGAARLREELAMAKSSSPLFGTSVSLHKLYYKYIAQCRKEQQAQGRRCITYKTFNDWRAQLEQPAQHSQH